MHYTGYLSLFRRLIHYGDLNLKIISEIILKGIDIEDLIELNPQFLTDCDPHIKQAIVTMLANMDSELSIKLLSCFFADSNPHIRALVAKALKKTGLSMQEELIIILLLIDSNPEVSFAALDAIQEIDSKRAIELITPIINDSSDDIKEVAIYALGEIGSKQATSLIAKSLDDPNPYIQEAAIMCLGENKSKKTAQILKPLLLSPIWSIKIETAAALGQIGSDEAIKLITQLLKDKDIYVRIAIILILKGIEPVKAIMILEPLLKQPNPAVQKTVINTLTDLYAKNTKKMTVDISDIIKDNFTMNPNQKIQHDINIEKIENSTVAIYNNSVINNYINDNTEIPEMLKKLNLAIEQIKEPEKKSKAKMFLDKVIKELTVDGSKEAIKQALKYIIKLPELINTPEAHSLVQTLQHNLQEILKSVPLPVK